LQFDPKKNARKKKEKNTCHSSQESITQKWLQA
jgi:hypothetical protein